MKSKFSKFLAAITLASSAISSFNGCVSGMESEDESQKKIIENLSEAFLDPIKTEEECDLFDRICGAFGYLLVGDNPKRYEFYKEGMTLGDMLYKFRDWMRSPDPKKQLIPNYEWNHIFSYQALIEMHKLYGKEKINEYIDWFFDQILKNIFKNSVANEGTQKQLGKILINAFKQVDSKFKKVAMENLKIEIQKAEEERNDPKNQNINQCAICLDNASKDKKDIMIKCCKKFMHQGCYDEFLKKGGSKCPYCNQPFDKDPLNINK